MSFQTNDMLNSMMNDSFLLDLTKSCKVLPLRECREVTPEAFHHLYKNMMEKSTKLRELDVYLSNEECTSFLKLIGIIFRGGKFFSNRSIEIYECLEIFDWGGSLARWIIFDGNIEISNYGFLLKLHESQE
ncbi:hypothetical protein PENTCL1PPCAC_27180, partial [Pristionchus entomophagus]